MYNGAIRFLQLPIDISLKRQLEYYIIRTVENTLQKRVLKIYIYIFRSKRNSECECIYLHAIWSVWKIGFILETMKIFLWKNTKKWELFQNYTIEHVKSEIQFILMRYKKYLKRNFGRDVIFFLRDTVTRVQKVAKEIEGLKSIHQL